MTIRTHYGAQIPEQDVTITLQLKTLKWAVESLVDAALDHMAGGEQAGEAAEEALALIAVLKENGIDSCVFLVEQDLIRQVERALENAAY